MPRVVTRAQREALARIYVRDPSIAPTYRSFRRTVQYPSFDTCLMVPVGRMWLGVEADGYTHS